MQIEIPLTYPVRYRQRRHRHFETVTGLTRRSFVVPDMDSRGLRQVAVLDGGAARDAAFPRLGEGPVEILAAEGALWRAAVREGDVAAAAEAGTADPRNPFVVARAGDGLRWNVAFDAQRRQVVRADGQRYGVDPVEVKDDGGEADAALMARHVAQNVRIRAGMVYVRTSEPCIEIVPGREAMAMSLQESDRDFSHPAWPANDLHNRRIEAAIQQPSTRWRLDRLDEARDEAQRLAAASGGLPVDPGFAVLELDPSAMVFCDDAWHVIRAAHYAENKMMAEPANVPVLPASLALPLFAVRDACEAADWRATRPMFDAVGALAEALAGLDPERLRDGPPRNGYARHQFDRASLAWPRLHAELSTHVGYAHARWRERAASPLEWIARGAGGVAGTGERRAVEILTIEDAAKGAFEARCPEAVPAAHAASRAEARLFATLDADGRIAAFGIRRGHHAPAPIEPLGRARQADLAAMEALVGLESEERRETAAFAELAP